MLWKMVARWAVMAIAVPLAAVGARRLSQAVEARRGPSSRTTRLLRQSADALQGISGRSSRRRRWWRR
ncbi:MAG TPA: hypothetical protein VFB84_11230 [Micromonosporaceae bacterium]|nr:hypothetical protein [Micromonosporaceae bacterium]